METEKGKEDRRETGREGETNYEKPDHSGIRGRAREAENQREGELFPLGL